MAVKKSKIDALGEMPYGTKILAIKKFDLTNKCLKTKHLGSKSYKKLKYSGEFQL